jgi:histidinol-phosphate aminotransferase
MTLKRHSSLQGVKEQVLRVPAYTLRTYEAEIKLNQNENPYDFPGDLKEEVFRRYRERSWARYPDFVPDGLRAALARTVEWDKEGILVGNGSNELLQAALLVMVKDRTPVVIPSPTFTVYGLVSQILGARIVTVPLRADMSYDVDELLLRAEEVGARVLIVCTPNNPTGSILNDEGLKRILDTFTGHVLLDEAYFEFCGCTGQHFLKAYPRLIITRTFSKAMGMAGLRVGYLMAHPELASQIAKAKLPYNVNQFSLTAAQVALENLDKFRPAIGAILEERTRLGEELGRVPGVKVYPTGANFFLFEIPVAPRAVFEDLAAQGVLVRDVSAYPMLSSCLRVTVGSRAENDRFLTALRTSLGRLQQAAVEESPL